MERDKATRRYKRRLRPKEKPLIIQEQREQAPSPFRSKKPPKDSSKRHGKRIMQDDKESLGYHLKDEDDEIVA